MFTYFEALEFLGRRERKVIKPGLERIKRLLEILGNPHKNKKIIHIAGTKGKGSTGVFITNLLISHGFKVGLYTSPHLQCFRERISINKKLIESRYFGENIFKIKDIYENDPIFKEIGEPTLFEILTALAFKYFEENNVDFIVLEVGLGGRLDATNIIDKPLVSIITTIDYDHTEILGNTIKEIAFEKAGIIKENSPIVTSKQREEAIEVIKNKAKELNSKIYIEGIDFINYNLNFYKDRTIFSYKSDKYIFKDIEIKLLGKYQVSNSSLAIKAIEIIEEKNFFKLNEKKLREGLFNSFIAGRGEIIEKFGKIFIIDGSHNVVSISELKEFIKTYFNYDKINLIFGVLGDKDIEGILKVLIPITEKVIFTAPEGAKERRVPPFKLNDIFKKLNPNSQTFVSKNIREAFEESFRFFDNRPIVVTGSFYVAGEFRTLLNKYNIY
ncbi:MAG: folylpolyglutamate synthase/dihydrofolate synthase family protein [Caldisericia bacterium]|jgi:dihydrofolate synthase/folylpolyglutamate synthase|nr:folylpolyglutamate synthase/dihydrofolate synthase family protein [Caldisericia bacterium]